MTVFGPSSFRGFWSAMPLLSGVPSRVRSIVSSRLRFRVTMEKPTAVLPVDELLRVDEAFEGNGRLAAGNI